MLLDIYIVVNFRIYEISWDICKLTRIPISIKKKILLIVEAFSWNFAHHSWTPVHMKIHLDHQDDFECPTRISPITAIFLAPV